MLSKRTVIILGAGASMPYGFPSGEGLLRAGRLYPVDQLPQYILPQYHIEVPAFHRALHGTLERSIDAMLETRDDIVPIGKAFMARWLLEAERRMRDFPKYEPDIWYETLWGACDLSSLEAFRATPLTIVTYNYDRSLEFALARSLRERFSASEIDCAKAFDCIGPIHLHGQLGHLPAFTQRDEGVVPFGGSIQQLTDGNCVRAASAIRIVHEPKPQDEAFVRARDALAAADRVIFLGFSYAKSNIERLLLPECLRKTADVYLCVKGFRPEQQVAQVRCYFGPWWNNLKVGHEIEDIVQFFRRFPDALF